MKEKPILFTAPMVRAILEGRKTQTRRLNGLDNVNERPDAWNADRVTVGELDYMTKKSAKGKYGATFISHSDGIEKGRIHVCPQICPYIPGQRVWVRETFAIETTEDYEGDPGILPPEGPFQRGGHDSYRLIPRYRATAPETELMIAPSDDNEIGMRWTPSIYMPRWASRITLEITGVRVERLQDIRIKDCVAEGIRELVVDLDGTDAYKDLWQSINGPGSWDKNPWVWVVEFKRVVNT